MRTSKVESDMKRLLEHMDVEHENRKKTLKEKRLRDAAIEAQGEGAKKAAHGRMALQPSSQWHGGPEPGPRRSSSSGRERRLRRYKKTPPTQKKQRHSVSASQVAPSAPELPIAACTAAALGASEVAARAGASTISSRPEAFVPPSPSALASGILAFMSDVKPASTPEMVKANKASSEADLSTMSESAAKLTSVHDDTHVDCSLEKKRSRSFSGKIWKGARSSGNLDPAIRAEIRWLCRARLAEAGYADLLLGGTEMSAKRPKLAETAEACWESAAGA